MLVQAVGGVSSLVCHGGGAVSACLAWGDLCAIVYAYTSAEKAEPSETPWHTYDGTPATA